MGNNSSAYRKFVSTGVTTALVTTAVAPGFAATFTDVADNYKESVNYLVNEKITLGKTSTKFGTHESIKRVDAAVMLAKALKLEIANVPDSGFTDVPERAKAYVDALKAAGIVNGKSANSFAPHQNITRGEVALLLANAYELKGNRQDVAFTDVASRYMDAVAGLVTNGITTGKTARSYGTDNLLKRGEFAVFLHKLRTMKPALLIGTPIVAAKSDGTATVTASVQGADGADAKVEIISGGTVVATKTVKVVDTKVTADFTGLNLSAGSHTARVTVNGKSAETAFTLDKVTITNINASTINGTTTVTAQVANAPANADAKVDIFASGNTSTPAASKTVKVVDGKITADFSGLASGTYTIEISVGDVKNGWAYTIEPSSPGGGAGGGGGGTADTVNNAAFMAATYVASADTLTITGLTDVEVDSSFDLTKLTYSDGEATPAAASLSSGYTNATAITGLSTPGTYFYNNSTLTIRLSSPDASTIEALPGFSVAGIANDQLTAASGWNVDAAGNLSPADSETVNVTPADAAALNTAGTYTGIYEVSSNATYGPGTTGDTATLNGSLFVNTEATLRNLVVNGTIFVNPGANGIVTLNNVRADNVVILSGTTN
ncbi:S-layer homology domain-containing protein [Domibacillus epiphyticus]|uniref:SLH domain-containing protein n=1 Tax=Domibacillus epiphyticus TaxID=1714355 RepID=A0A1V2A6M5_9BACI|nr:S-layer homology domain-containing protein [Domibacillus epiphyticus]OMP66639.1 hypothetical protein BTO28_11390 [Domibacillus epiphyticus]